MRYILRFCLQPGFHVEEKLDALLRYVRHARIDEVMFFLNCEELFEGHISIDEYAPWLETIRDAAGALRATGCDFSLNPWTTILHLDRGRGKPEGLAYQSMVGPDGAACEAVACPADAAFTDYLCGLYAHFATLSPKVLWIEDDFRLHNHTPLLWGGCFCPDHMRMFSEALGHPVDRETFVREAFAAGPPNPYREAWLTVARQTMVTLARRLGAAVRAANPQVAIGLMSSQPAVHCVELRDWHGVFEGFATAVPAQSRPHLPAYGDIHPTQYLYRFAGTTARTVDSLPAGTPVYPELENFPHSRFAKSDAMAGLQMELALACGIDGMTLNIFDMMGNGVDEAETFGNYLRGRKPYLAAVAARRWCGDGHVGVRALYDNEASRWLRVAQGGENPGVLRPQEDTFAGLLGVMGVSCLPREAALPQTGQVLALCGQILRGMPDAEIEALFAHNRLLLDGECAVVLLERGLGRLIGARAARVVPVDSGVNAYEQACDGVRYAGMTEGRVSCQNYAGDWVDIDYADGAAALISRVRDYRGRASGAGMALVGDAVAILPYRFGIPAPVSHFTRVRQQMLQRVLRRWGVPVLEGGASVGLYVYDTGLLLANACQDDADGLSVAYAARAGAQVYEIDDNGSLASAGRFSAEGVWRVPGPVARMRTRAFVFGEEEE